MGLRFLNQEEQARYWELCLHFGKKAQESLRVGRKSSNSWKVLLLNENGIITPTFPELDLIAEYDPDSLKGFLEDAPAVCLKSAGDTYGPNNYLANQLAKLIRQRNFSHAVIIEGLRPKEDSNSSYGLSYERGERFRVIKAPAFDDTNSRRLFTRINPDYTIDFDDSADPHNPDISRLYTRPNGLSRLYLGGGLDAYSGDGNLAYSNGLGRVVVVSAEGTAKNFGAYASKIEEKKEELAARVKRNKRAEALFGSRHPC